MSTPLNTFTVPRPPDWVSDLSAWAAFAALILIVGHAAFGKHK